MRLASPIAKHDVWQMLLAGSIVDLSVCRMGPDGNIAKHQAGTCGLQQPFGKSFLHACAQPENNSKPGQQTGRSTTSEAKEAIGHATNPEQRKSWQTAMFYGLRATLQSAVFGKCSSRETLQNNLFDGCSLQKTCRNIVLGECGLQGASPNPRCLRAQPEHDRKPSQPCCAQGFQRFSQTQLPSRA